MNPYNCAHDLARALAESQEYRQYEEARKKLETNQENLKMVQDFRVKQLEIQQAQVMGQNVDERIKQLEPFFKVLSMNPAINEFLQVEMRFSQMMMDIQKIIGEAVGVNEDSPQK